MMSEAVPLELDLAETEKWLPAGLSERRLEDQYILGDMIGRGVSSTVYKCLYKGKKECACKIIRKTLLNRNMVLAELVTLQKLKHPHIVQLRDVFENHTEIQMVLELMTGGEVLERLASRGHYTEGDAVAAVRQILSALQYLHGHGSIHGDLKPEHLLYQSEDENAQLKIADCGLSHLLQRKRSGHSSGYLAPEKLLNKEYGPASDLWSLGIVIYIMLCGFEPFWDETGDGEVYNHILKGEFSFPSPWWEDVSDSAKDLISQLLQLDPTKRLTAAEALNHPWIQEEPTNWKHLDSTVKRLREFNAKRKFRVATHAVLATHRALYLISPERKQSKKLACENMR